jgi:hypothetical protein
MRCTLSSAGVPLGSVLLAAADRTVAPLETLPAYLGSQVREVARAIGIAFHAIDWSGRLAPRVGSRALASAVARAHELQCTLCLTDERGSQVPVASVLVIEFPRDRLPIAVVNLRERPALRGAALRPGVPSQTEKSR